MYSTKDVAAWMTSQLENQFWLYHETVVGKIKNQFGNEFVYQNRNGNLAIDRKVLTEFRKLTDGKIVWERSEKAWRKLKPGEKVKGRQIA